MSITRELPAMLPAMLPIAFSSFKVTKFAKFEIQTGALAR